MIIESIIGSITTILVSSLWFGNAIHKRMLKQEEDKIAASKPIPPPPPPKTPKEIQIEHLLLERDLMRGRACNSGTSSEREAAQNRFIEVNRELIKMYDADK